MAFGAMAVRWLACAAVAAAAADSAQAAGVKPRVIQLDSCAAFNGRTMTAVTKNRGRSGIWPIGADTDANSCGTTTYAAMYYTWARKKDRGFTTWDATCPMGVCEGGVTRYGVRRGMTARTART